MPPSKRIIFGEAAVGRIVSAVKRVEASPYFNGTGGAGGPRNWNPGLLDAIVTTAIPAGTSGTYSTTGRARIKIDDGSGNKVDDVAYTDPVEVLNGFTGTGTIAVGKFIQVKWRNGKFLYAGGDC